MSELPGHRGGRVGILLNPHSGRVRGRLTALRALAAAVPGAEVHETARADDVATVLQRVPAAALELLVVVGGDGTLQAVLTALLREPAAALPSVLVIPAGTTNMSAADLGARQRPPAALRALARWRQGAGQAPTATARAVLRVDGIADGSGTAHGLFFGAGAIHSGVRYFQQRVRGAGVHGGVGPLLATGRLLAALLRNRPHPLLLPLRARCAGAGAHWEGDWLLLLASTLDRLLLGSRPHWGTEIAPLHFTAVAHRPRRLWRTLAGIARGRTAATATTRNGYVSHNLEALDLDGVQEFVLDGECFTAVVALRLTATAPMRFLAF